MLASALTRTTLTGASLVLLAALGGTQRAVPPDAGDRIPGTIAGT